MSAHRITASRWHEFACGHRVYRHESKCAHLHGHNYRVQFTCEAPALDAVGRVIDFSVIKTQLCDWLEMVWDHRMLLWEEDPLAKVLKGLDPKVVVLPFNPTAENMAQYLLTEVAPAQLLAKNVVCTRVEIYETGKCSAVVELPR